MGAAGVHIAGQTGSPAVLIIEGMSAHVRLVIALLSTTLVGYTLLGALPARVAGDTTYGQLAVFNEVVRLVNEAYVEPVNMDRALSTADMGLTEAVLVYLLAPGILGVAVALFWCSRTLTVTTAREVMRFSLIGMAISVFALAALDYGVTAMAHITADSVQMPSL